MPQRLKPARRLAFDERVVDRLPHAVERRAPVQLIGHSLDRQRRSGSGDETHDRVAPPPLEDEQPDRGRDEHRLTESQGRRDADEDAAEHRRGRRSMEQQRKRAGDERRRDRARQFRAAEADEQMTGRDQERREDAGRDPVVPARADEHEDHRERGEPRHHRAARPTEHAGIRRAMPGHDSSAGRMNTIAKNPLRSVHAGHDASNTAASDISWTSTSSPLKKPGWPQALASFTASVRQRERQDDPPRPRQREPGEPAVGSTHQ